MKEITVTEQDFIGNLYIPENLSNQLPGIMLLSGSDGGVPGANAIPLTYIESLTEQGYVILALAYFGITGLPVHLENIDLVYFEKAAKWLQARPEVDKDAIALIGQSRGAELALILASTMNYFQAVAAYAPSNMVTGGFPHPNRPAWQYKGAVLEPFLGGLTSSDADLTELDDLNNAAANHLISKHANTEEDPVIIADLFTLRNTMAGAAQTQIAVEDINCPLLLFSGGKDAIWTSDLYCKLIIERLKKHRSNISCKHINYKDAGHGLIAGFQDAIYHPVGGFWCQLGGAAEGNLEANQQSTQETINFLSQLKNKSNV